MRRLRSAITVPLFAAAIGLAAPVQAQPPALRLTLEDAIARGLAHSHRLAEAQARADGAAAGADGRESARRPLVAVLGGYTRTNHVDEFGIAQPGQPPRVIYPDIPDNVRSRLDLQWPIYTGGRAEALERAARAEHRASLSDLAAARADLRLEIARAFWALVTARATGQVLGRSLASIEAHVQDLRSRLDQGLIPPNEVLSAEAQRARQRLQAIEAANTAAIAEADLQRLIGLDDGAPIEPAAVLEIAPAASPINAEQVSQAVRQRPERHALEQRVDASGERQAATAGASRPQFSLAGGYDYARPNARLFPRSGDWRQSWDVSANVSWTIWDGGRRAAERGEAAAGSRAAEARLADFDRQAAFEIRQRHLEIDSSLAAVTAADEGVRAATEARRVVRERFTAGVATSTDVLDAELALLQADLDRTRALASTRLAAARLARAMGKD